MCPKLQKKQVKKVKRISSTNVFGNISYTKKYVLKNEWYLHFNLPIQEFKRTRFNFQGRNLWPYNQTLNLYDLFICHKKYSICI